MIRNTLSPKRKIIQYILIIGIVLGVIGSVLRIVLALFGMISLPVVMNADSTGQSSTGFTSVLASFVFAVTPYILVFGAVSAFVYAYFFPDKESRNVLVGWGVLMILYLIASMYFAWL